jgi:hypothetical protein
VLGRHCKHALLPIARFTRQRRRSENMIPTKVFLLALLAGTSAKGQEQEYGSCPLLGKAYPPSIEPSSTTAIKDAQRSFASLLEASLKTGMTDFGPLDSKNTTFSISVFTSHERKALFEYHHLPSPAATTSGKLDGDTLYRIGSVAKVHAVYTILSKLGNEYWDKPIVKFVPELANAEKTSPSNVKWAEVTLGSLASHLSGVTRDCKQMDFTSFRS